MSESTIAPEENETIRRIVESGAYEDALPLPGNVLLRLIDYVARLEVERDEARTEAERRSNVVHQSHQPYPLMYGPGRVAELLAKTPPVKGCFDPLCTALAPKESETQLALDRVEQTLEEVLYLKDIRIGFLGAELDEAREMLWNFLGGYDDLIYLIGKPHDLEESDHPLYQERKDSRVDEEAEKVRRFLGISDSHPHTEEADNATPR